MKTTHSLRSITRKMILTTTLTIISLGGGLAASVPENNRQMLAVAGMPDVRAVFNANTGKYQPCVLNPVTAKWEVVAADFSSFRANRISFTQSQPAVGANGSNEAGIVGGGRFPAGFSTGLRKTSQRSSFSNWSVRSCESVVPFRSVGGCQPCQPCPRISLQSVCPTRPAGQITCPNPVSPVAKPIPTVVTCVRVSFLQTAPAVRGRVAPGPVKSSAVCRRR